MKMTSSVKKLTKNSKKTIASIRKQASDDLYDVGSKKMLHRAVLYGRRWQLFEKVWRETIKRRTDFFEWTHQPK